MSVVDFEMFYVRWLDKMKSLCSRLRQALLEHQLQESPTNGNEEEPQEIVELVRACYSHYTHYVNEKVKLCEQDASFVVSGMWRTPLEVGFLWMGGWRPTTALVLAYSLMGMQIESELQKLLEGINLSTMAALSARQLSMLDSLQQRLQASEDQLSNRLAVLQMLLADQPMARATAGSPPPSESNDLSDVEEAMKPKLAELKNLLEDAEHLRSETVREMLDILRPVQAAQYTLAAYEMLVAVQKLGHQREGHRPLLPSGRSKASSTSSIREFALSGDVQNIQKALEDGSDPSEADDDGRTRLLVNAGR